MPEAFEETYQKIVSEFFPQNSRDILGKAFERILDQYGVKLRGDVRIFRECARFSVCLTGTCMKALHKLRIYHHPQKYSTSRCIQTIYNQADFHKIILHPGFNIGKSRKNSAEYHKYCITADHNLGSW